MRMESHKKGFDMIRHLGVVFLLLVTPAYAIQYTIQDLGTFGGYCSVGYRVNNSGQVAGWSALPDGGTHAFFYDGTDLQDLGTLGGRDSYAYDLNDKGQVVGVSYRASSVDSHAFLWENGTMTDLHMDQWETSQASCISSSSRIAGGVLTNDFVGRFAIWDDQYVTIYDGAEGYISAINSVGQFAGALDYPSPFTRHAFFAEDNWLSDLGTLGGTTSQAFALNDHGQVVGYSELVPNDNTQRPFLWEKGGGMQDLGLPPGCTTACAFDINNLGQVVGYAGNQKDDPYADPYCGFLYDHGTMYNLNDLIDPNSGWIVQAANGINDHGQITGYGNFFGVQHAYIMTPVPEPGSLTLLITTLFFLRTIRRSFG